MISKAIALLETNEFGLVELLQIMKEANASIAANVAENTRIRCLAAIKLHKLGKSMKELGMPEIDFVVAVNEGRLDPVLLHTYHKRSYIISDFIVLSIEEQKKIVDIGTLDVVDHKTGDVVKRPLALLTSKDTKDRFNKISGKIAEVVPVKVENIKRELRRTIQITVTQKEYDILSERAKKADMAFPVYIKRAMAGLVGF